MATTHPQKSKVQPWKANWPPAKQNSDSAGQKYMVDDSGAVLSDGDSSNDFSEFNCFRKGIEVPKDASNTDHQYMVDDAGALLVDGAAGGGPDGSFMELACSSKDVGHTYLVDSTGSLLIDGASGGGPDTVFTELSCSRQPVGKEE